MERLTEAHEGHRARLRRKVVDAGLEALAPHEILEFLLYHIVPRQDVNALAHRLLERFGSVEGVLRAESSALVQVPGVGPRSAEYLLRVGEAARACASLTGEEKPLLNNFLAVLRYAGALGRKLKPPCCVQLCLDRELRLLYQRAICPSRAWGEPETLRAALGDVLSTGARHAILLEYVGKLNIEAEDYDLEHLRGYAAALHAADSALLDFLILGDAGSCSLRQTDQIPDFDFSDRARSMREDYLRGASDDSSTLHVLGATTEDEEDVENADGN